MPIRQPQPLIALSTCGSILPVEITPDPPHLQCCTEDEAAYRGFMPPAVSFDRIAAKPPVSRQLSWAAVRRGTEAGQDLFSWQQLSPLLPSLRQKHRENRI